MAIESILECSKLIAGKKLKIAFAESATAGWLASEFSFVPESGEIFLGGIVCYDVCVKEELFGIPKETIEKYTAESSEITELLAERLVKFFRNDISVAITGLTSAHLLCLSFHCRQNQNHRNHCIDYGPYLYRL